MGKPLMHNGGSRKTKEKATYKSAGKKQKQAPIDCIHSLSTHASLTKKREKKKKRNAGVSLATTQQNFYYGYNNNVYNNISHPIESPSVTQFVFPSTRPLLFFRYFKNLQQ